MRKTVIRVRRRAVANDEKEKRGISELVRIVCIYYMVYIYILNTSSKGIKKGDYSVDLCKTKKEKEREIIT